MNYPMAIVIASALIAGAMFFSNQNDLGAAGNGEWAAVGVGVERGVARAWAVSVRTGTMKRCRFHPTGSISAAGVSCFIGQP